VKTYRRSPGTDGVNVTLGFTSTTTVRVISYQLLAKST